MLFKLSNLNSNFALTQGYLNLALNNSAQGDNLYTSGQLCRKFKATENFGKLSGDCNIQGDRYIQGRLYYLEFVIHGGRGSSTCGSLINKTTELKVKL